MRKPKAASVASGEPSSGSAVTESDVERLSGSTRTVPAGRHAGAMVIEQLLNDWIAERNIAVDLSVAARTARAIASEIESHFSDVLARARAEVMENTQQLAEREQSLNKALEVITRLESQLAHVRDRSERELDRQHAVLQEKDAAVMSSMHSFARLEAEVSTARERLQTRLDLVERELATKSQALDENVTRVRQLEQDLNEKEKMLTSYRQKFGVIIKAVR